MAISALQLLKSHIEEVSVKANQAFDKENSVEDKNFQVFFQKDEMVDDPCKNRVRLTISQTGPNVAYHFRIIMVGFFEVSKEYLEKKGPEDTERLVAVNGPAVLYSAAREVLATISARGPYRDENIEILLPTITFINFQLEKAKDEKKPAKKPTKKKKKTEKK